MARHDAAELAIRLGRQAEAVCRHYLSNGRRQGRYWLVGDVRNTKGRSMFVRLVGPETGKRAVGKFAEYVTPRVMSRFRDRALPCLRLTAFMQHSVSAREMS
ncbi:hypothetical protein AB4144_00250 [Rhizobiaceae sp. 2RAB30]